MRLALVPFNPNCHDVPGNAKKIMHAIGQAVENKCNLIVFPEFSTTGRPLKNSEHSSHVFAQQSQLLTEIKRKSKDIAIFIGISSRKTKTFTSDSEFCLFLNGQRQTPKTGDPFLFKLGRYKLGWGTGPKPKLSVHAWLDTQSSSFAFGQRLPRQENLRRRAQELETTVIWLNCSGTQGQEIFAGGAEAYSRSGKLIFASPLFCEDVFILDLDTGPFVSQLPKAQSSEEILAECDQALQSGLKDLALKSNLNRALVNLSGDVSSALSAVLAVQALGENNVAAALLPAADLDDDRVILARELAESLNIDVLYLDLNGLTQNFEKNIKKVLGLKSALGESRLLQRWLGRKTETTFTPYDVCSPVRLHMLRLLAKQTQSLLLHPSSSDLPFVQTHEGVTESHLFSHFSTEQIFSFAKHLEEKSGIQLLRFASTSPSSQMSLELALSALPSASTQKSRLLNQR